MSAIQLERLAFNLNVSFSSPPFLPIRLTSTARLRIG